MSLLTDDDRYELTLNSEGGKPMNMREMPDRVEARDIERGRALAYSHLLNRFTEHVIIEKPCITSLRASILE